MEVASVKMEVATVKMEVATVPSDLTGFKNLLGLVRGVLVP